MDFCPFGNAIMTWKVEECTEQNMESLSLINLTFKHSFLLYFVISIIKMKIKYTLNMMCSLRYMLSGVV